MKRWRDEELNWDKTKELSVAGDAVAMCDVGWAHHQGLVPTPTIGQREPADVPKALKCYELSARSGYSPAAGLLGDIYYYGEGEIEKNDGKAKEWLKKVLEMTKEEEPEDAYLRGKGTQKLGVLAHRNGEVDEARSKFNQSTALMRKHLNGNWAFILPHDPPGLWEFLSKEQEVIEDTPKLAQNLNGFATSPGFKGGLDSAVQLRAFTNKVRSVEAKDSEWAVKYQLECLETFREGEGAWGVTYLESFMRILGHPTLQSSLRGISKAGKTPKVVVLGSALGNQVIWGSAAFGFEGVGYDVLGCCVEKAEEIADGLKGEGGEGIREKVKFEKRNVTEEELDLDGANLVWSNDHEWGEEAQRKVEKMAFEGLKEGGGLVLYRPPLDRTLGWREGVRIGGVATSWNPSGTVFLLIKGDDEVR